MKKKHLLNEDDKKLFKEAIKGTKKLKQDTFVYRDPVKTKSIKPQRKLSEQSNTSFYFSDEYQPQISDEGPVRYIRPDVNHHELKKLRRGDYVPDLFLDLHGLTLQQTKQEIAALIDACLREHVLCSSIMHGHGKNILKQQLPLWLAQHPDIAAFHQAPKEFGGNAALLILVTLPE